MPKPLVLAHIPASDPFPRTSFSLPNTPAENFAAPRRTASPAIWPLKGSFTVDPFFHLELLLCHKIYRRPLSAICACFWRRPALSGQCCYSSLLLLPPRRGFETAATTRRAYLRVQRTLWRLTCGAKMTSPPRRFITAFRATRKPGTTFFAGSLPHPFFAPVW